MPTALYWKGNKVKAELALAKGKQSHDKRATSKDRDWARDKAGNWGAWSTVKATLAAPSGSAVVRR